MSRPISRADRRAATADRILRAAQDEFGERGLEATTIRAIADRAGVDPSLVLQHYGSKGHLFSVAAKVEGGGEGIAAHLTDVLDAHLDGPPPDARALIRSMLTAPEANASMRAFLDERVASLAEAHGGDHAELRAALTVASFLGLTLTRHFLGLEALLELSDQDIEEVVRPWIMTALSDGAEPSAPTDEAEDADGDHHGTVCP